MNPPMSSLRVRKVCSRTTSRIVQPAASTTTRTFSSACLVWLPMSGPATRPSAVMPTWPATITSSPPRTIMPCEYIPSGRPNALGTTGSATGAVSADQLHVLELHRLAVDAAGRRRDPSGELARLYHRLHQTRHEGVIVRSRQPLVVARVPLRLAHD